MLFGVTVIRGLWTFGILLFYLLCLIAAPIAARFLIPRFKPAKADAPVSAVRLTVANPFFWLTFLLLAAQFVMSYIPD